MPVSSWQTMLTKEPVTPAWKVAAVPAEAGVVQALAWAAKAGAAVNTASAVMPAKVPIRRMRPKTSRPTPLTPSLRDDGGLAAAGAGRGAGMPDSSENNSFDDIETPHPRCGRP